MTRRWMTTRWTTSCALASAVLLGAACASSSAEPEARDATSLGASPAGLPEPKAAPGEAAASELAGGEPSRESAPAEAIDDSVASREPVRDGSPSAGEQMTDFFGIGRGDRVADLGGVSGYSLSPVRRALGPAGVLYVRRSSPPASDPSDAATANDLAPVVWMKTPDEAPLTPEATRLNAVTLLFGYHAVIAAGRDRRKMNAAVYRALVPGGMFIIADHAAPPGSGLGAARELNAVEDGVVRMEVQGAGFEFVEAADFVSNAPGASERSPGSQYVLKFAKPR